MTAFFCTLLTPFFPCNKFSFNKITPEKVFYFDAGAVLEAVSFDTHGVSNAGNLLAEYLDKQRGE